MTSTMPPISVSPLSRFIGKTKIETKFKGKKVDIRKNTLYPIKDLVYRPVTSGELISLIHENFKNCATTIMHGDIKTNDEFKPNIILHFYSGIEEGKQKLDAKGNPITDSSGSPVYDYKGYTLYPQEVLPIIRSTNCPYTNVSEVIVKPVAGSTKDIIQSPIKHYVANPGINVLNYNVQFDFNKVGTLYTGYKSFNKSYWCVNLVNGYEFYLIDLPLSKSRLLASAASDPRVQKVLEYMNDLYSLTKDDDFLILDISKLNVFNPPILAQDSIKPGAIVQFEITNKKGNIYYIYFKYLSYYKGVIILEKYIPPDLNRALITNTDLFSNLIYIASIKVSIFNEAYAFFLGLANSQLSNIGNVYLSNNRPTNEYNALKNYLTVLERLRKLPAKTYENMIRQIPADPNKPQRTFPETLERFIQNKIPPKNENLYLFMCSEITNKTFKIKRGIDRTSTFTRIDQFSRRSEGSGKTSSMSTQNFIDELNKPGAKLQIILDKTDVLRMPSFKTDLITKVKSKVIITESDGGYKTYTKRKSIRRRSRRKTTKRRSKRKSIRRRSRRK